MMTTNKIISKIFKKTNQDTITSEPIGELGVKAENVICETTDKHHFVLTDFINHCLDFFTTGNFIVTSNKTDDEMNNLTDKEHERFPIWIDTKSNN